MSSPLSALPMPTKAIACSILLIVGGVVIIIIFSPSVFMVSPLSPNQRSAFATFPGENGRIAFVSQRDGNGEIYVMNLDGSEQINISNDPAFDYAPDWSPDGTKIAYTSLRDGNSEIYVMNADGSNPTRLTTINPTNDDSPDWGQATAVEDTTPPVITVPDDITEEATRPDGAEVSFEVTVEDDVDGTVDVSCDYDSGDIFPIGETVVTCSAEDAAGNRAEESFTITVQDTTDPDVEITEAVDRRRSGVEIPDGGTTPINYIKITFEATDAVGIDKTECS